MKALLANLAHAADDDIVNARGIDPAAVNQSVEDLRTQVRGVPVLQRAAASSAGRPSRFDNVSLRHHYVLPLPLEEPT